MRFPKLFLLPLFAVAAFGAGESLNPPTPFLVPVIAPSPGEDAATYQAAFLAQSLGFPTTAAALYQDLLKNGAVDRTRVTLALATALMDQGDNDSAERVLDALPGNKGASWHLRKALLADAEGRTDAARSELAGTRFDELPPPDKGWYYYLQGRLDPEANHRSAFYFEQAANAAVSPLQRSRFLLAREQALLKVGGSNPAQLEVDQKNTDNYMGQKIGYTFARAYAVALNASGKKDQAIAVLQVQLRILPKQEKAEADEFRLLLGVIAGARDSSGRHALIQLLGEGSDPDHQRIALQLLAEGSTDRTTQAEFRQTLDTLIATPHPILESLLLYRARLHLAEREYGPAEADAHSLIDKFPGSALKAYADMVLTGSAWDEHRYRAAADYAAKASVDLAKNSGIAARPELGVLVAEAWFRAEDYRAAADAYAAALRDPPSGVPVGALMFQRVQAEIKAGGLSTAETVLDELEKDPNFDATHQWEAEWNLAKALEINHQTEAAYDRVNRLIQSRNALNKMPPSDLELRARVSLLQAKLSLEAGKPEETVELVGHFGASLTGVTPALKTEIASYGDLLKAQAQYALNQESEASATMAKLRSDYPGSDAAIHSYLDEAAHYAQQDKVADALQLYTKLTTDFPDNLYAPYALYLSALQAERLDRLPDANQRIEDLVALVAKYPNNPVGGLVFRARLEQGDILRRLNQYPQAQRVYEDLINNGQASSSSAEDSEALALNKVLAELALAECHNAQSSNDATHADRAASLFEDILDRSGAPVEVRVEAGYNLGEISARVGKKDKAQAIWWAEVVAPFLLDDAKAAQLGAKGRYWMARTLLEVGIAFESMGKLEEAKRSWLLILQRGLPGETLAKARLERYHLFDSKAPDPVIHLNTAAPAAPKPAK